MVVVRAAASSHVFLRTLFSITPSLSSSPTSVIGSSKVCVSKMSTRAVPKFAPIQHTESASLTKSDDDNGNGIGVGPKFRVVSYNILAQTYVKSSLFPHSPSPCLKWKARCQAVLTVLKSFEADFLCLQELDEYDTFYKVNVESYGYSSIYIQRSGQKRDGCGIFYNPNKAELVIEEKIDYNDLVNSIQDETTLCADVNKIALDSASKDTTSKDDSKSSQERGDPNDPRVRLKRDCVGIMAAFKLKDSQHFAIVANTHIYWDPEWADVKLAQAKYLLSRLRKFRTLVSHKFQCEPSVLIAGDFNSLPGDKVYQYLVSGSTLPAACLEDSEDVPIPLTSVYAYAKGEPEFTNCTPDFTGTLDYIFFSPSEGIKPISYLELSEHESPDVKGGLPNYHHPSDHLPIGADFFVVGK